jgi:uncharacterized membrane protein
MPEPRPAQVQSDEDRILRVWTPFLLRTILAVAAIILVAGLILMATHDPGYYVRRYQLARTGTVHERLSFTALIGDSMQGDPHSVMTIGLLVLTLVPLGRVAFSFLLFLIEKDYIYVALTAYVLAGLVAGVLLGRIG